MNYGMLPPSDVYAVLSAKLHDVERQLANLREELAELRERVDELEAALHEAQF